MVIRPCTLLTAAAMYTGMRDDIRTGLGIGAASFISLGLFLLLTGYVLPDATAVGALLQYLPHLLAVCIVITVLFAYGTDTT